MHAVPNAFVLAILGLLEVAVTFTDTATFV